MLGDRRPLFGTPREALPRLAEAGRGRWLDALRERALAKRPPTGFEPARSSWHGGERSDELDIQAAGTGPIAALALWAGAAAGVVDGSTTERLAAGADAGVLSAEDASTLADVFALAFELRIAHHMQQLDGLTPTSACTWRR